MAYNFERGRNEVKVNKSKAVYRFSSRLRKTKNFNFSLQILTQIFRSSFIQLLKKNVSLSFCVRTNERRTCFLKIHDSKAKAIRALPWKVQKNWMRKASKVSAREWRQRVKEKGSVCIKSECLCKSNSLPSYSIFYFSKSPFFFISQMLSRYYYFSLHSCRLK
jgi:hypothetical protein